jgi:spermidine synthase
VRRLAAESAPNELAYDLILTNLPYPTSLQLNRFYTVEFWQLARSLLADDGVLAFPAPGSLTYMSPAMRDLHNGLLATLTEVFPHVRPIPGNVTLWLASSSEALDSTDVDLLVERWQARDLPSDLITDFHIRLRLDSGKLAWFRDSLQGEGSRPATANTDLRPSGLLYGLAYWNELFSPGMTPYFNLLQRLTLPMLAIPLLALVLAGVAAVRLRRHWHAPAVAVAIATTGFAGMAADLLVIFAFQISYGHVYRSIGLLIAAFMAGLSMGGWLSARSRRKPGDTQAWLQDRRRLAGSEAALLAFWLVLPASLTLLYGETRKLPTLAAVGPALFLLNALAGFLVGAQFPLANRMYRDVQPGWRGAAGVLYALDLLGAFAAALLVSVALLPALGIVQTCLLVAMLKAGSLALVLTMRRTQ